MNQITLDTVRQMMKRELGRRFVYCRHGSVSLRLIPQLPTACINAKGELKYSPAFVVGAGEDGAGSVLPDLSRNSTPGRSAILSMGRDEGEQHRLRCDY